MLVAPPDDPDSSRGFVVNSRLSADYSHPVGSPNQMSAQPDESISKFRYTLFGFVPEGHLFG